MATHGLRLNPDTFFYGYDPQLNPGVFNVFAAAAYRVGHTQVPSTLWKLDPDHNAVSSQAEILVRGPLWFLLDLPILLSIFSSEAFAE